MFVSSKRANFLCVSYGFNPNRNIFCPFGRIAVRVIDFRFLNIYSVVVTNEYINFGNPVPKFSDKSRCLMQEYIGKLFKTNPIFKLHVVNEREIKWLNLAN